MTEASIQEMLASMWPQATPDVIDVYDDQSGDWMRITAEGVSRLVLDEPTVPGDRQ